MNFLKNTTFIGISNILNLFISFFTSILFVRMIGADIYGRYVYITAFIAIIPIWYNSFDQILIRFGSLEEQRLQQTYLKATIIIKILFFFISASTLMIYLVEFENHYLQNEVFRIVILTLMFKEFIAIFNTSFSTIININKKYILLSIFSLLNVLIYFCSVCLLYFLGQKDQEVLIYTTNIKWIGALIVTCATFFSSYKLLNQSFISYFRISKSEFLTIFSKEKLKYFVPLQLVTIQSYFKLYLPNIFLGNLTSYENVSYFEITRKLFSIIHKFAPKILKIFIPSLLELKEKNYKLFESNYLKYSYTYFVSISFISILMLLLDSYIAQLFNLDYNSKLHTVYFLFSLDLMLGAIIGIYTIHTLLSESTMGILNASLAKTIIGTAIMYFLVNKIGLFGAVYGKMIDSVIILSLLVYHSYKDLKIVKNLFALYFIFSAVMYFLFY